MLCFPSCRLHIVLTFHVPALIALVDKGGSVLWLPWIHTMASCLFGQSPFSFWSADPEPTLPPFSTQAWDRLHGGVLEFWFINFILYINIKSASHVHALQYPKWLGWPGFAWRLVWLFCNHNNCWKELLKNISIATLGTLQCTLNVPYPTQKPRPWCTIWKIINLMFQLNESIELQNNIVTLPFCSLVINALMY